MVPHGKGLIKFEILAMRICTGSATQAHASGSEDDKEFKIQAGDVNSKLSLSVFSRASLYLYFSVVFCTWMGPA